MRSVVIVGSGPAGLTAALYSARANLKPLVIEGLEAGGQLMLTTLVENWPGHRDGIMGPALMDEMRAQAIRFGAEIIQGNVESVSLDGPPFTVKTHSATYHSRALIIATGATARLLGLPSERALIGRGVSTCATCDGFFFRGKPIAVVGGGDSAMEEAVFLTKFASHVTVIHRRDTLRASKIMQDKAFANPKISFEWNSEVVHVEDGATGSVTSLVLRNLVDRRAEAVDGRRRLRRDRPYAEYRHSSRARSRPTPTDTSSRTQDRGRVSQGVFACGDVQDHTYRQAVTAAGSGCMAAIDAERYLDGIPQEPEKAATLEQRT